VDLDPMTAFERKVVHDEVLAAGLVSDSSGSEPRRFVVVHPAAGTEDDAAQPTTDSETSDPAGAGGVSRETPWGMTTNAPPAPQDAHRLFGERPPHADTKIG